MYNKRIKTLDIKILMNNKKIKKLKIEVKNKNVN